LLRVCLAVQLALFFFTLRAFALEFVICFVARRTTPLHADWGGHAHDLVCHVFGFLFKLIARLVDR
jgi:hypothetical protein